MAGTTQTIKRFWGKVTSSVSNFVVDGMRAFYEQHNLVIADLEKLRAGEAGVIGSATYDPASLADGVGVTTTVTATGAALGDFARASFSLDLQGILLTAYVSAANTVAVRFQNETTGTIDLASGTLRVRVSPSGTFTGAASDMTASLIATVES